MTALSYRARKRLQASTLYAVLIILGLAFVFPFFWMAISSVKLNRDVLAIPIRFFPPSGTGRATTTCSRPSPTTTSPASYSTA